MSNETLLARLVNALDSEHGSREMLLGRGHTEPCKTCSLITEAARALLVDPDMQAIMAGNGHPDERPCVVCGAVFDTHAPGCVFEDTAPDALREAAYNWRDGSETRTIENIPDPFERTLAMAIDVSRCSPKGRWRMGNSLRAGQDASISTGMSELLPCPFCGKRKARPVQVDFKYERTLRIRVKCDGCEALGPWVGYTNAHKPENKEKARREAMEVWNRRVPPPGDGGLREALDEAVRSLECLSHAGLPGAKIELIADVRGYASNRAGEARAALGRPAETQGGDDTITVYETGGMAIATVPALSTETQGSG